MFVRVTIEIDGRQAGVVEREVSGNAATEEEDVRQLQRRAGRVLLENAFNEIGRNTPAPECCGRPMLSRGMRTLTIETTSGPVCVERRRCRCSLCGREAYPADADLCTGTHRISRALAKRICQLATVENFPHLKSLVADQHGVSVDSDTILDLAHDVGAAAEARRLADAQKIVDRAPEAAKEIEPRFRPPRLYISCDGIMYCTNIREELEDEPGKYRLLWQQMKVGCVSWQDAKGNWNKQMIWGRESPKEFGAALFDLACRCGYRDATEKIFASDGGPWCWDIRDEYFSAAEGILDWYHASEHVWKAARVMGTDEAATKAWAAQALEKMRVSGGAGLREWLRQEQAGRRGKIREALGELINYVDPRTMLMDYARYRASGFQIGTGMMESTCNQLVGMRLKGPGMHWTEQGAIAITALRATDLNQNWHQFWRTLELAA